jgi:MurNAc alpha-1-phosphate uridylyltransferase
MVLAAGLGLRMRPLSLQKPKPLLDVAGRPLISYAFDRLKLAGVKNIIVNVHHLAGQVEEWARKQDWASVTISDERGELLDTGGGIARALPWLGNGPFFVLNSDTFWTDDAAPALSRLIEGWRDDEMDCLLLLSELQSAVGYEGPGDFRMAPQGNLERRGTGEGRDYVYAGAFLVHPRLFRGCPKGRFSMNILWDKAIAGQRLFGLIHEGKWFHVGTPAQLALAESMLSGI